ncbi:MAG: carbohydrate ABC transporter permease [Bacillota bacterium]|nr:carbohydrate ABC transporter permease [Bacillota bacterium]
MSTNGAVVRGKPGRWALHRRRATAGAVQGGPSWRPRGVAQWAGAILVMTFVTAWAVVSLVPLVWLFTTALTPSSALLRIPPDVSVRNFSLDNFKLLQERAPLLPRWFLNTVLVASAVTVFNLFFDTLAGYTFAKLQFPGRDIIFWTILCTMMIPGQVTLVPMFMIVKALHWYDSYFAILIPAMAGVFGIFLMKQYIQTLPSEIEDAARVDGCSEFGIWWRIILPLCKPGMAVLGIFVFMAEWKAFMWPLIVLKTESKFMLEQGLATLQQQFFTDYGLLMSGAAFSALPMILVFFVFQRYLMEGWSVGGVLKG